MPLYECTNCHAVENTALNPNYWFDVHHDKKPALCTECDPQVGKWHGKFPRVAAAEYRRNHPDSKIEYPAEGATTNDVPPKDR